MGDGRAGPGDVEGVPVCGGGVPLREEKEAGSSGGCLGWDQAEVGLMRSGNVPPVEVVKAGGVSGLHRSDQS